MKVEKIGYSEPRPFWIFEDVKAFDCSKSFGNPSGHSVRSTFFLLMSLDLITTYEIKGLLSKSMILFSTIWIFIMGFSRVLLGAHSIDQVLYGWSLGLWLTFFFHNCLR